MIISSSKYRKHLVSFGLIGWTLGFFTSNPKAISGIGKLEAYPGQTEFVSPVSADWKPEPTPEPKEEIRYTASMNAIKAEHRNPGIAGDIKREFGDDYQYALELVFRESSLNPYAVNPESGACNLSQALPCEKMNCDLGDSVCALKWMHEYVNQRYGGIRQALEFHDINNWY